MKPVVEFIVDEINNVYSIANNSPSVGLTPRFRVLKCRPPRSDMRFNIIDTEFDTYGENINISIESLSKTKILRILEKSSEDRSWYIENEKYYIRVSPVDMKKYSKDMTNKRWKKKLYNTLYQGIDKDERIVNSCMCDLICLPMSTTLQGYNPHRLMFTNTGTGKTTFAHILGSKPIVRPTEPGLIGGGKISERTSGELEGVGFVYIDEINTKDTLVLTHLLNYMENGIVKRGIQGSIQCKGTKTLVFCGNPKLKNEIFGLLSFKQIVQSLAGDESIDRIGKRIGILLFGNDYKTIEKRKILSIKIDRDVDEVRAVCGSFMIDYKTKLRRFITMNEEWLNSSSSEYQSKIRYYSRGCNNRVVSDFIRGMILSECKVRMQVIKFIIVNNICDFVKLRCSDFLERYKQEMEDNLVMFMGYNIDSMGKIVNTKVDYKYEDFKNIAMEDKSIFEIGTEELSGMFNVTRVTMWDWKTKYMRGTG